MVLESWVYAVEDLEPAMRDRMGEDHPGVAEVVLVFLVEPRRTELLEGEKFLELAVRASVREEPGGR